MLEDAVALSLAAKNWGGTRRQIDLDLAVDIRGVARRVVTPTLVVGCRQDQMVPPAHARALAACIPGADFRELDCGHVAPQEREGEQRSELRSNKSTSYAVSCREKKEE